MQPLSAVVPFLFRGRDFFVKRDDLIDPLLSGNKYRKLYTLIQTPARRYRRIVSYGGTQSNAMLSIAALCDQKGWDFHYTCKPVPEHLKSSPTGNLKLALGLGMQLHEVEHKQFDAAIASLGTPTEAATLFVPQGGADPIAQAGINVLAREIKAWQQAQGIETLHVVTPSGTGTTAFYLAHALPDVAVLTTACVGDRDYLIRQMRMLGELPRNLRILENEKKHHFARPYAEFLALYRELKEAGIEFDLIYGANMWHTLLQNIDAIEGAILYVHSGGLMGNETMLDRYRHKGL
ncbi:pyridoxal-phosphate dependent enzyme [Mariprofundus sp. KV]|uniref:pyridoxal-phosphate dependent enzyme n=1 Tax=Mariprofundus sp. KV TaxID=2608715 RepID=UPI0015A2E5CA|nr:pyridoxal-phosphate dependent enzyme [Mariprofundus sp. KV]NWF35298.1 pyridoxal-phosphate dependent enzyme [Mariprofundus sp. KV]